MSKTVRGALIVVGIVVVVAAFWLAYGLLVIDGLAKTRAFPIWWVIGALLVPSLVLGLILVVTRREAALRLRIILGLVIGGAVSLIIAGTLNGLLIHQAAFETEIWWVGLTEEGSKLLAAVLVTIGFARNARNGLMIGAAVGFGFAIWENVGYFFGQYNEGVQSAGELSGFILMRAVTGGCIHALLTALVVAAAFWAIQRPTWGRIAGAVGVFALMALLHSGYDWLLSQPIWDGIDDGVFTVVDLMTVGFQLVMALGVLAIVVVGRRSRARLRSSAVADAAAPSGSAGALGSGQES